MVPDDWLDQYDADGRRCEVRGLDESRRTALLGVRDLSDRAVIRFAINQPTPMP